MWWIVMLFSCGAQSGDTGATLPFSVVVPALLERGEVPVVHTCDGDDRSPEVRWTGVPPGTAQLLLVVDDPDAPGEAFPHWLAWSLPAEGLAEGASGGADFLEGANGFGSQGWAGPCPPRGQTHRYVFALSALSAALELDAGATRSQVDAAAEGLVVDRVEISGTYARSTD